MPNRIVIIGGGIAGLAAAYRLQGLAPDGEIVLIEREPRLGGKILTEHVDGFVVEAGPDSFLASKPEAIDLCRELGIEGRLQGTNQETRGSFVLRGGRLYPLPEGLSGLVPTRLGPLFRSGLLSLPGKLRVALEYVVPIRRRESDESLGSFIRRRLGSEAYERLIEPLLTGIYGGDGDELSLAATFPRLREMERAHGSLIRALRAAGGTPTEPRPVSAFLTPIGGMSEFIDALCGRLDGVRLLTATRATAIGRTKSGFAVAVDGADDVMADAIVLATPAYVTADLLTTLDPELAGRLREIPYTSAVTVSLAYPEDAIARPLLGHGYLIPRCEGRPALACTWTSSKFEHRAPAGHALLRVFLGRSERDDLPARSDDELLGVARAELADTLGITAEPELSRIYRWDWAMPQYRVGHLDRLRTIQERLQRLPGVVLAGAAYRAVGIPDCIRSGGVAARQAAAAISEEPVGTATHPT